MKNSITVRSYRKGDEEEIVRLLKNAFDSWPVSNLEVAPLEHWKWKYLDNPQEKVIVSLAEMNSKIVGCFHAYPFGLRVGDRTVSSFDGVDLTVEANLRGTGVTGEMRNIRDLIAIEKGIEFHLSFNRFPQVIKSLKRRNYSVLPQKINVFVIIRDINRFLKENRNSRKNFFLQKYGFYFSRISNSIHNMFSSFNSKSEKMHEHDIVEIKKFDDEIDRFWNEIKDYYDLILVRDKEYLNWRYCDKRASKYHIILAKQEEGEILGYMILKIEEEKYSGNQNYSNSQKGYIVDLLTLPHHLDIAESLLVEGIKIFDSKSVNLIQSFMIKNHPYERVFRKCGFLNGRNEIFILYKAWDPKIEIPNLTETEKILFHYGDIDWI